MDHELGHLVPADRQRFAIAPDRGVAGSPRVLGEKLTGIVPCDRWRPYESRFGNRRHLCWVHIDREAITAVDRGKHLARSRVQLRGAMTPVWSTMVRLLASGVRLAVVGTCRDLLRQHTCLWIFMTVEGVEPTNNAS